MKLKVLHVTSSFGNSTATLIQPHTHYAELFTIELLLLWNRSTLVNGFGDTATVKFFLSTPTQNDKRKRRYLLLRGWVIPHQLLQAASVNGTLNMLAISKYSCRVCSLTFGSEATGRAVEWVCGHSLAGTEVSKSPGALMSLSCGSECGRWTSLRRTYPRQEESYWLCMLECRRGQTKKE